MRRSLASVVILVGAMLTTLGMGGGRATAQAGSFLRGTVLNTQGTAVSSGVIVEALATGTLNQIASTTTNASGIYSLTLAPATYDLRITSPSVGAVAASQSLLKSVAVAAATTTTRDITLADSTPSVPAISGKITINGQAPTVGQASQFARLGSYGIGAGRWTNNGGTLVLTPSTGGSITAQVPSDGTFLTRVPAGTYSAVLSVRLYGGSGSFGSYGTLQLERRIPGLVVTGDQDLGNVDFALVLHTVSLTSNAAPVDGFVTIGKVGGLPPIVATDDFSLSTFQGPVSGSAVIPLVAVSSAISVSTSSFPGQPAVSTTFTPSDGGTTSVTLALSLSRVTGSVKVNGLAPVPVTAPLPGNSSILTLSGKEWKGSFSISFYSPSNGSVSFAVQPDGTFTGFVPNGTYTLTATGSLGLTRAGVATGSNYQRVMLSRQLPGLVISGPTVLTETNFELVNHQFNVSNADGASASDGVLVASSDGFSGAPAASVDAYYSSFESPLVASDGGILLAPMLSKPSTVKLKPAQNSFSSVAETTFVPVSGGTTTLTVPAGPIVSGRITINGAPGVPAATGASVFQIAGSSWSGSVLLGFLPVASTLNGYATYDGFVPFLPGAELVKVGANGSFSGRVKPGSYTMLLQVELQGGQPGRLLLKRQQAGFTISGNLAFGDVNFQVDSQSLSLINADGSSLPGFVQARTVPAVTPEVPFPVTPDGNSLIFESVVNGSVQVPFLSSGSYVNVLSSRQNGKSFGSRLVSQPAPWTVFGTLSNTIVTPSVTIDNDGDGIADSLEAAAPNADVDSNGVNDSTQTNVASIPAAIPPVPGVAAAYVSVAVPVGLSLTNVQALPVPTGAAAPPAGTTLPEGLVKFVIPAVTPAADVTIRIYSSATNLTGYAKLFNGVWSQMPADRVTIGSGWVDVRITDNGIGDDDPTLGRISDPGAVISGESNLPRTQGPGSGITTTTAMATTTTTAPGTTTTSVQNAIAEAPLSFAPVVISSPVNSSPTTTLVSTVTTQPTGASFAATTTAATIPAAALVQATPIPPAPGPAQAGEVEPAFTGSNSIPLTAAGAWLILCGLIILIGPKSSRRRAQLKHQDQTS